jgi:uncharacterized protein
MKLVIDTNVILVSLSRKSKLHWIFESLQSGEFQLCVDLEIMLEYEEIITRKMGVIVADSFIALLDQLDNVTFIRTYYKFHLLEDKDDNKFVDVAIASNADFIITHDKDFNVLKSIAFPQVEVIDSNQLSELLHGR